MTTKRKRKKRKTLGINYTRSMALALAREATDPTIKEHWLMRARQLRKLRQP